MSVFFVILHGAGPPPAPEVEQALMSAARACAPDDERIWRSAHVTIGQAQFNANELLPDDAQPRVTAHNQVIVSHARIDDRETLGAKLALGDAAPACPDSQLILLAHKKWGSQCAERLLGDFGFAIWDEAERQLFCAVDQFGVRGLYYAPTAHGWIISNAIACVLAHPEVPRELDDISIADFLTAGQIYAPDATAFKHIRALPGGCSLSLRPPTPPTISSYWALPIEDELSFKRPEDCVEQFRDLFRGAVADRLRSNHLAVSFSGGMDSTSCVAMALQVGCQTNRPLQVDGVCAVYDRLIPDNEREWSQRAAAGLGIRLAHVACDDLPLFDDWANPALNTPQPQNMAYAAQAKAQNAALPAEARLLLNGIGGDPIFYPSGAHALNQLKRARVGRLAQEMRQFHRLRGGWPPVYLRSQIKNTLVSRKDPTAPLPIWLSPQLAANPRVQENQRLRWASPISAHPTRPEAYALATSPFWQPVFRNDVSASRETIYPFFDVRLVRFVMRLSPLPWFASKTLLREAMRGLLPEAVRTRPKTPLRGDPTPAQFRRANLQPAVDMIDNKLEPFVDARVLRETLRHLSGVPDADLWQLCFPLSLARWLHFEQAGASPKKLD